MLQDSIHSNSHFAFTPLKGNKNTIIRLIVHFRNRLKEQAFNQIKIYSAKQKKKFLIPLLSKKYIHDLQKAFLTLKLVTQSKQEKKLQQKIIANSNPYLLLTITNLLTKNCKILGLDKIKSYSAKIKIVQKHILSFANVYKQLLKERIRLSFYKLKKSLEHKKLSESFLTQILRIQKKAMKRLKQLAMNSIIQGSLLKVVNKQLNQKQDKMKQLSSKKIEQQKSLTNLRQQVKNLQSTVYNESNERNKAKRDSKNQGKILKMKLEDQCKSIEKEIIFSKDEGDILQQQLKLKRKYHSRRVKTKKNSAKAAKIIQKIYNLAINHQQQQFRNQNKIKPLLMLTKNVQDIDQYHIYENLRLREQIRLYEKIHFEVDTPEYNRSKLENQRLKYLIQLLAIREFENPQIETLELNNQK